MLFAFLGVHLSEHHYNEQCATQQDTNDSSAINNYPSVWIGLSVWASANHDAIEALAAIGGLIFSFVLTVSTVFLWIETRNAAAAAGDQAILSKASIDLARKEFTASHRPKLRIRRIYLTQIVTNSHMEGMILVANIGETPAKIVAMGVDVFAPDWLYNADSQPLTLDIDKLYPGDQGKMDFKIIRALTKEQTDSIQSQTFLLKILGSITYLDDSGISRFTSFSRKYDYVLRRFIPVGPDDPEGDREYED